MKKIIGKIFVKEIITKTTKFNVYKLLTFNENMDKIIYGDIKWFIKKDIVNNYKFNVWSEINISNIETKNYTNKNGENITTYTLGINEYTPLSDNEKIKELDIKLLDISNTKRDSLLIDFLRK